MVSSICIRCVSIVHVVCAVLSRKVQRIVFFLRLFWWASGTILSLSLAAELITNLTKTTTTVDYVHNLKSSAGNCDLKHPKTLLCQKHKFT